MTKMIIATLLVSLTATLAYAEDVAVFSGIYAQDGYLAPYICASAGALTLYQERDVHSGYDLTIAKYDIGYGLKVAVRQDDNLWTRPGLQFGLGGGSAKTQVLVLAGLGDAPTWVDVSTPAVPLAEGLALTGHFRVKEGGKPEWWVGPSFTNGRFGAWYHHNFRSEGSWEGGIDYQLSW